MTEILNPGPISNGTLENRDRRGTDLELILDKREVSNDIPSPLAVDEVVSGCRYAGASPSIGDAL